MQRFLFAMTLLSLAACGKIWKSHVAPKAAAEQDLPSSIQAWTGKTDQIESKWHIKPEP